MKYDMENYKFELQNYLFLCYEIILQTVFKLEDEFSLRKGERYRTLFKDFRILISLELFYIFHFNQPLIRHVFQSFIFIIVVTWRKFGIAVAN